MQEAPKLFAKIQEGPWYADMKHELLTLASARVGTAKSASRADTHNFIMSDYLPKSVLLKLQDASVAMRSKIYELAQFCCSIGLLHPNETTSQHIVGVLLMAHYGGPRSLAMDPTAKYCTLQDFKSMLKTLSPKFQALKITTYPDTVAEFRIQHSEIYDRNYTISEPSPLDFNPSELSLVTSSVPMRKSRAGVAASSSWGSACAAASVAGPQDMAQQLMMMQIQMMQQMTGQTSQTQPGEVPIRFLPRRHLGGGGGAPSASTLPLALPSSAMVSEVPQASPDEALCEVGPDVRSSPVAQAAQQSATANDVDTITDDILNCIAKRTEDTKARGPTKKRPAAAAHDDAALTPVKSQCIGKDGKARPAMPSGAQPTNYLGGVVYVMLKTRQWRVYCVKGSKKDFKLNWGASEVTKAEAWSIALSRIEASQV